MFKILKFFGPKSDDAKIVTQRERFEAVCDELNAVLGELEDMPVIRIDASARRIEISAPSQFADEALALPKPDDAGEVSQTEDSSGASASEEPSEKSAA